MRRTICMLLAVVLALAPATPAFAEHLTGSSKWKVTFTPEETMEDTYSEQEWADEMSGLQPGDDITFTVTLSHEHGTAADWYMSNEVLKSLEEGDKGADAAGSGYEYLLEYQGPSESKTLYDSRMVGGTDSDEGLNEATDALEDFIFLDNLKKDQTGTVTLKVTLDGETEGNAYFDTLARLKMRFAVELDETGDNPDNPNNNTTNRVNNQIVRTGDDTNLFPLYMAMVVSGVLFALLAAYGIRERRREAEEVRR